MTLVGKMVLAIFVRCKSLIYIEVKIDKIAFLDFFYTLNVKAHLHRRAGDSVQRHVIRFHRSSNLSITAWSLNSGPTYTFTFLPPEPKPSSSNVRSSICDSPPSVISIACTKIQGAGANQKFPTNSFTSLLSNFSATTKSPTRSLWDVNGCSEDASKFLFFRINRREIRFLYIRA